MGNNLKKILVESLPLEELLLLVGSYDVVGDIAIVLIPKELEHRERFIGETILATNNRIKVVAKKAGIYEGEFRTLPLTIIAGENRKETIVKEFGLSYSLNPEEVYFSVRSGVERKRIASLVEEGEEVMVFFSGIGPYPLIIAKFSRAARVFGVEKNPVAHRYALRNLVHNKMKNNIHLICGDVKTTVSSCEQRFDRVIMPLPRGGESFLPQALKVLKPTGTIHFYQMQKPGDFDQMVARLSHYCGKAKREIISTEMVRAGHCGPRTFRVCADVRIRSIIG